MDIPPFNKSLRDGYACRREDLGSELTVLETIHAGRTPTQAIHKNQCSKIMTGAMVPKGADCVVMVEYTEHPSENTMRFTGGATEDNISPQGEDMSAGSIVLRMGERIAPQHIAVLAALGCDSPFTARRPRVGIIETGDELVEPSQKPDVSQIRACNGPSLYAQVTEMGCVPFYFGIAGDAEEEIDNRLQKALSESDVVLISGGVSMGDLDLVPDSMTNNGLDILFNSVAVKPGKPTTFGVSGNKFCFGLPGNPVSTFIQFELLVKPFLFKMMGHEYRPKRVLAPLSKTISQKKVDRESWIPVALTENGEAAPCDYHGSAHVNALCGADGLISLPVGFASIEKGTKTSVRLL